MSHPAGKTLEERVDYLVKYADSVAAMWRKSAKEQRDEGVAKCSAFMLSRADQQDTYAKDWDNWAAHLRWILEEE